MLEGENLAYTLDWTFDADTKNVFVSIYFEEAEILEIDRFDIVDISILNEHGGSALGDFSADEANIESSNEISMILIIDSDSSGLVVDYFIIELRFRTATGWHTLNIES